MAQSVAALSTVSLTLSSPLGIKRTEKLALGLPKLSSKSFPRLSVVASTKNDSFNEVLKNETAQSLIASTIAGSFFSMMAGAGSASAAEEIMQIAEGDSRGFLLLFVLLPALGWVAFNVFKPALNQINKMTGAKSVAGAVGLGALATLMTAPEAEAAQEITQIAADSRPLILLLVLGPALGWVLFNVAKPALNQINKMTGADSAPAKKKRGVLGAVGLGGASLLASESANAAQEITQLAADNRPLILLLVLVPALGWVLFNVAKPAFNQIKKMTEPDAAPSKKKK